MKLTREQREKILCLFPTQRGNVKVDNSRLLDAIIYICENGCKWRALPETFGPWHTIYVRINRWAKNGVLERLFHALQEEQVTNKRITILSPDSTSVKVHPDAAGALKKPGNRPGGNPGAD
ncbi:MAG: transposase [Treponema sp.]|jgi:transposase|nr:transposase [Treponema sp.]